MTSATLLLLLEKKHPEKGETGAIALNHVPRHESYLCRRHRKNSKKCVILQLVLALGKAGTTLSVCHTVIYASGAGTE